MARSGTDSAPPNGVTIVYAVRHGETEWNARGLQQGHLDSPLTENGLRQAAMLADGLEGRGIERIYSSDLGRARRTAEIIARKLDLAIVDDRRLRERHLGVMQGLTKQEFRERYPEEHAKFATFDPDYAFPEGESARQRYERNVAGFIDIAEKHPGEIILTVSHGGALNSLLTWVLGLPLNAPRRFSLFNAAINRFSVSDGVWQLDTWGELTHLEGIAAKDDF